MRSLTGEIKSGTELKRYQLYQIIFLSKQIKINSKISYV